MVVFRFWADTSPTAPVAMQKIPIHIPEPSNDGTNAYRIDVRATYGTDRQDSHSHSFLSLNIQNRQVDGMANSISILSTLAIPLKYIAFKLELDIQNSREPGAVWTFSLVPLPIYMQCLSSCEHCEFIQL